MFKRIIYFSCFIVLFLASCTTQKSMSYLRQVDASKTDTINNTFIGYTVPKIKHGDQLFISVNAIDPDAAAPFNLPTMSYLKPGDQQITTTLSLQTYVVLQDGSINYPVLGNIPVAGLTRVELTELLTEKLSALITDPIVTVQFVNFTVTVMGEVTKPGQYSVTGDRVTLLDALAMAGDMTPYGKRNNLLVTRENNGKLEFARINLNTAEIFESPYYYLQQNDIIYVEPNSVRAISSQNISLYLSMITSLASMATVIVSITNSTKNH